MIRRRHLEWVEASGGGWVARVGVDRPHFVLRVQRAAAPGRWRWSALIRPDDIARGDSDDPDTAKAAARQAVVDWLRASLAVLEAP